MTKAQIQKKVASWKWRMIKACGTVAMFCEATNRSHPQMSEWLTGRKPPKPESVAAVEADLEKLGV
jgi:hypothetical protein